MSDVAEPQSAQVLEKKYPQLKRMMGVLDIEASNPENIAFDVDTFMEGILSAETDQDVFEAQELGSIATKDYLNKPFYLRTEDVLWQRSQIAGGFPFYAMLTVTDQESGEEVTLNGGGISFVSVLWKLQDLNYFDPEKNPDGKLLQLIGKQTLSGTTVVMLKPVALPNKSRTAKRAAGAEK